MNNKNKIQSLKDRLLRISKEENVNYTFILIRYGIEGFLKRLSLSSYKNIFILKGSSLFYIWFDRGFRPTFDVDFSMIEKYTLAQLEKVIKNICKISVDDGLTFNLSKLNIKEILKQRNNIGYRLKTEINLGNTKIPLQVDIGIDNPEILKFSRNDFFKSQLDFKKFQILTFDPEKVIAEKFEFIVKAGMFNSRIKDYYDIWFLLNNIKIDKMKLAEAIKMTFKNRNTKIPFKKPIGLSKEYHNDPDKLNLWKGFINRTNINNLNLEDIVKYIWRELSPIINNIEDF